MKIFKNFIFDWSGTLVDDLGPVLDSTNKVFNHFGKPAFTREEFCSVLSSVVEESKATHLSLIKTFDQYARGRHQLHFDEFVSAAAAETQPGLVASFLMIS